MRKKYDNPRKSTGQRRRCTTPVNVAAWPRVTRAKIGLDWRVLQRTQEKRKQTANLNELQNLARFKRMQRNDMQKCKSERQFCLIGPENIERSKGVRRGHF